MKPDKLRKLLSFSVSLLLFLSCTGKSGKQVETEDHEALPADVVELREDQIKLAGIVIGAVEQRSLSGSIKASGLLSVAPEDKATVSTPMGGVVKSTSIRPGQVVKKGQTLAVIENLAFIDLQQSYLEAQNTYEMAKADYSRQRDLFEKQVGAQKDLQQTTAAYKTASVTVKALEQKLRVLGIDPSKLDENSLRRTIPLVAPISGYVTSTQLSVGQAVDATDVLVELVNSNRLYLDLTLFDQQAGTVKLGQHVRFTTNNETEQHEAVVRETGKSIGSDKSYHVYADVVKPCANILPGMYVNAHVIISGKETTTVPDEALVRFDDKEYVFIVVKDKMEEGKHFTEYRMVQVEKGLSDAGYTAVTFPSTVDPSTIQLVVKGAYNLLSALKNAGEMSC
jgi:cobalt-zinc-cadmium efflux system membrane fusion protein